MKFCHRMYEYLYLDHYDGQIAICPWMQPENACIGNLKTDEISEAYNSEHANYLRSTMDDQSFKHCRPEACPYLQNNNLEEITEEEYNRRKKEFYYPTIINLAYDYVCNQNCETCRETVFLPPKNYAEKMHVISEKIAPCLERAQMITASGHGDPFASKYMMDVLTNLLPTNPDLKLLLETNGVFFDEEHWGRIKHLGEFHIELVVTTNSFNEFTYRHISRGGNYEKMLKNLDFMTKLRKEGKIKKLAHSFVIQDRNFREIPEFIRRSFENYAFDTVVLKPVYQWGTMKEEVFWFKDVLNPLHPYHQEYLEIMQDPILKDPRVFHFGGDTVHAARPYPRGCSDTCFPYQKVKRGEKVILYGAGRIGRMMYDEIRKNNYCTVVLWVDQCGNCEEIHKPEEIVNISNDQYDKIVLSTINPLYSKEMKEKLFAMGIKAEKIISIIND